MQLQEVVSRLKAYEVKLYTEYHMREQERAKEEVKPITYGRGMRMQGQDRSFRNVRGRGELANMLCMWQGSRENAWRSERFSVNGVLDSVM